MDETPRGTGRGAYEIAGADRAAQDTRAAMGGGGYWRRPDVRLPEDPELRLRWLAGYAAGMTRVLAQYQTEPVRRVEARGSDPAAAAEAEGDFGPGGTFTDLTEEAPSP